MASAESNTGVFAVVVHLPPGYDLALGHGRMMHNLSPVHCTSSQEPIVLHSSPFPD